MIGFFLARMHAWKMLERFFTSLYLLFVATHADFIDPFKLVHV